MILNIIILLLFINLALSNKKDGAYLCCGLTGFSGPKDKKFNLDKLKTLMLWNYIERGQDATGIWTPSTSVVKDNVQCDKFLMSSANGLTTMSDNVFIGHVRAKTMGNNTKENAHPFHEGNIVLAHNGTLSSWSDLCREYDFKYIDIDVDSRLLAMAINKTQNPEILQKFEGTAAVIFADTNKSDTLYVFRNKERPLFRGKLDGCMYISSLEESLKFIGCTSTEEFKEEYLYTIKEGKIETFTKLKRLPLKTKKVTKTTYESHSSVYSKVNNDMLTGMWLLANNSHYIYSPENKKSITKDKWYLVTGYKKYNNWTILIIDEDGREVEADKSDFILAESYIKPSIMAVAVSNIVFTETSKEAARIGDLLKVEEVIRAEGTVKVRNIRNNLLFFVNYNLLRRISVSEYTSLKDTDTVLPIHFIDCAPSKIAFPYEKEAEKDDKDDKTFSQKKIEEALQEEVPSEKDDLKESNDLDDSDSDLNVPESEEEFDSALASTFTGLDHLLEKMLEKVISGDSIGEKDLKEFQNALTDSYQYLINGYSWTSQEEEEEDEEEFKTGDRVTFYWQDKEKQGEIIQLFTNLARIRDDEGLTFTVQHSEIAKIKEEAKEEKEVIVD